MKTTKKVLAILLAIISFISCCGIMTSAADPARGTATVNVTISKPQSGKNSKDFVPTVSDGRLLSLTELVELRAKIILAEGYIAEKAVPTDEDLELVYNSLMKDFKGYIGTEYGEPIADALVNNRYVWAQLNSDGTYTLVDKFTANTKCVCFTILISSWVDEICDATCKKADLTKKLDSRESWPEFADMMAAQIVDPTTATPEELAYQNECLEKFSAKYDEVSKELDKSDKDLSEIKAKYGRVDYVINEVLQEYHSENPEIFETEFEVQSFIQRIFAGIKAFFKRLILIFRKPVEIA